MAKTPLSLTFEDLTAIGEQASKAAAEQAQAAGVPIAVLAARRELAARKTRLKAANKAPSRKVG